jgi:hypothetical protein
LGVRLKARFIQASRFLLLFDVAPVEGAEPIRQASAKGYTYESVIVGYRLS